MDERRLSRALESLIGKALARDIAADFLKLRRDVATGILERTSAGKFVESFVQCLRHMSKVKHARTIHVDHYLENHVENDTTLPEGLRLCGSRVARSIYTMRNKRNIAHKGEIDPNRTDLEFTHHAAVWIMAELLRHATGIPMEEAAALIGLVRAPVGTLVEEIDGVWMVHAKVSTRVEILLLLHSRHPDPTTSTKLVEWVGKNAAATRARLSQLRRERLVVSSGDKAYRLTSTGYRTAAAEIQRVQS